MKLEFNTKERTLKDGTILTLKGFNKLYSIICNKMVTYGYNENGYVEISKEIFHKEMSNYYEYLEYQLLNGVIERDYYSKEKKKAFGYRFSEEVKDTLKIIDMSIEPSDYNKPNEIDPITKERINLQIDKELSKKLEKDFKSIKIKDLEVEKEYDGSFIDFKKYVNNVIQLKKWQLGNTFFKVKNGRLYNNFSFLSKGCRINNILLNNEEIVEFDIKNSFPLMLCVYCLHVKPELINNYDFQEFSKGVNSGKIYSIIQYGLNSIRNINKEGKFLLEENGKVDYDTRFLSRNETKLAFQYFLNGEKDYAYINGLSVAINYYISNKFPCIYDIVSNIKNTGMLMYDKLVKMETEFIIKTVDELYSKIDGIKILTLHDAIYVPKSFEKQVEEIWSKNLNILTKKLPKLNEYEKIEYFDLYQ